MVLYHAVSSYQLLEVMLHRKKYHQGEYAVLLLPDFITDKYPQYKSLEKQGFFQKVYLFPYTKIPHGDELQILLDTARAYEEEIPWKIEEFHKIYVAGAHFYFSLYLMEKRKSFTFFEDAPGLLSRPERLRGSLKKTYSLHASLAEKHGLFTGNNPCISTVICLKKAQSKPFMEKKYKDFSVERELKSLSFFQRKKILRFFLLRRRIATKARSILLTENFAGSGMKTMEEQIRMYQYMREHILKERSLIIKPHPDDHLDYSGIFPNARIIKQIFPSELLPYVFWKKPETIYTFSSTGCETLRAHFHIQEIRIPGTFLKVPTKKGGTRP